MTHILIPREPSPALLRPFVSCPQEELPQAYAAMIRIAEVERARAGSQCLAQIEEPAGAAPAAVAPQGEDWRKSTTYLQRFGDAIALLCHGRRPDDLVLSSWLDGSSFVLQQFAIDNGPAWAQGIGLIDAATIAADQPTEGVAHEMRADQTTATAPAENMVRYCPGCGSVGTVESKYRDCCPDGGQARFIPQALAEKCRDTFKLAVDGLVSPQAAPAAPADAQAFAEWWDRERGTARNRLPGDDWMDLSNEDREQYEAAFNAGMRAAKAAPAAPAVDALGERDAAFEAVRKRLCGLQRYSFVLDDDGVVRRAQDRTGNWIEFDDAHALFDPVAVDAARAAQAKEGGEE